MRPIKSAFMLAVFIFAGCASAGKDYVWIANKNRNWDADKRECIERAQNIGTSITEIFNTCMQSKGHKKIPREQFKQASSTNDAANVGEERVTNQPTRAVLAQTNEIIIEQPPKTENGAIVPIVAKVMKKKDDSYVYAYSNDNRLIYAINISKLPSEIKITSRVRLWEKNGKVTIWKADTNKNKTTRSEVAVDVGIPASVTHWDTSFIQAGLFDKAGNPPALIKVYRPSQSRLIMSEIKILARNPQYPWATQNIPRIDSMRIMVGDKELLEVVFGDSYSSNPLFEISCYCDLNSTVSIELTDTADRKYVVQESGKYSSSNGAATSSDANKKSATDVYEKASPSVVMVKSQNDQGDLFQGSGVAFNHGVNQDGTPRSTWLVTNAHVVKDGKGILVEKGRKQYEANLKYADEEIDIALLLLDNAVIPKTEIGGGEGSRIGQRVYAIGSPLGLESTLTDGILSAKRVLGGVRLLQTTAPISRGNSGGGLFDEDGRLIGITTFKKSDGENLNFAVDADYVLHLKDALQASELARIFLDTYAGSKNEAGIILSHKFTKWLSHAKAPDGRAMYQYVLKVHSDVIPTLPSGGMRFIERTMHEIFKEFIASRKL